MRKQKPILLNQYKNKQKQIVLVPKNFQTRGRNLLHLCNIDINLLKQHKVAFKSSIGLAKDHQGQGSSKWPG